MSKQIKNNGIKSKDIGNGQVGNADLANNAVNGAKVLNGSLTAPDIKDEAGADYVEGPATFDLTGGHDLVSTIRVTTPTAGTVIANVSGVYGPPAISNLVECSLTTGTVTTSPGSILLWSNAANALDLIAVPFAGTRGFQVGAGSAAINLVCRDATGNANVFDVQLTAMFFPTRY